LHVSAGAFHVSTAPKNPKQGEPAPSAGVAERRRAREAEALRQNLLKRKAQKRARQDGDKEPENQVD
jgi:hypothetical protein